MTNHHPKRAVYHFKPWNVGRWVLWGLFAVVLAVAPLLVGGTGAAFERLCLRRVHAYGHVPELLITFGLSYVFLELVQLIWGRATVPFDPPALQQGRPSRWCRTRAIRCAWCWAPRPTPPARPRAWPARAFR